MMFGERDAAAPRKSRLIAAATRGCAKCSSCARRRPGGIGQRDGPEKVRIRIEAGEILGVAGVSGGGQKELGDLILGASAGGREKMVRGEDGVFLEHLPACAGRRRVIRRSLAMAAFPGMSVREGNLALGTGRRLLEGRKGRLERTRVGHDGVLSAFAFRFRSSNLPNRGAPEGNLQRAVVARGRWAHKQGLNPGALSKTRGLDIRKRGRREPEKTRKRAKRERRHGPDSTVVWRSSRTFTPFSTSVPVPKVQVSSRFMPGKARHRERFPE